MKWIRIAVKWTLVVLIGMYVGFAISQLLEKNDRVAVYSNRSALETDLIRGLEDYHTTNGRYPDSLDAIKIIWLTNENERRKNLLTPFYYENRGDKYVLWWPRQEL